MGYRVLAAVILTAHFAYLGYVLLGGFLAWRWPWSILAHLAAVGWAVTIVVADLVAGGVPCPLTSAEDWARRRAGQPGLTVGFIDRYLEGVLYPQRYASMVQLLVGAVVLASWLGCFRRRNRRAVGRCA